MNVIALTKAVKAFLKVRTRTLAQVFVTSHAPHKVKLRRAAHEHSVKAFLRGDFAQANLETGPGIP